MQEQQRPIYPGWPGWAGSRKHTLTSYLYGYFKVKHNSVHHNVNNDSVGVCVGSVWSRSLVVSIRHSDDTWRVWAEWRHPWQVFRSVWRRRSPSASRTDVPYDTCRHESHRMHLWLCAVVSAICAAVWCRTVARLWYHFVQGTELSDCCSYFLRYCMAQGASSSWNSPVISWFNKKNNFSSKLQAVCLFGVIIIILQQL